jgi:RNA polymerase sigma-70 factor (ECF subfamily)
MAEFEKYSDQELSYLFLSQDKKIVKEAFDELYRRYAPKLYTFCYKLLKDKNKARDALQEAFVNLFERIKQKDEPIENLSSYLYKIVKNIILNIQKKKVLREVPIRADKWAVFQESLEDKQKKEFLDIAINQLPENLKEVLIMKEYLNYSYLEISDLMNISRDAVAVMIFRAKKKLKDLLKPVINELEIKEQDKYGR